MSTLLVLGATSDIARATALAFAMDGWDVQLAGRDLAALQILADDLAVRAGRPVAALGFDALRPETHAAFWRELPARPDAVLCAVGVLGDQEAARRDAALAETIIKTNFSGLVPIMMLAADEFEARGAGVIIGIGSVAGDRGRASNYVYGAAKAGFATFLSGLRNRLAKSGARVLTVKPGFVATAMTEGMDLPPALTATPEQVAQDILLAVKKGKDAIYTRWFWRYIMLIIKLIPEGVFKKLSL